MDIHDRIHDKIHEFHVNFMESMTNSMNFFIKNHIAWISHGIHEISMDSMNFIEFIAKHGF